MSEEKAMAARKEGSVNEQMTLMSKVTGEIDKT